MPVKSNYALVNQPLTFTLSVKEAKESDRPKTDFLPADVKKVVMTADKTIVVLTNGKTGVAEVSNDDTYDPFVGLCIAYFKAKNKKVYRLKEALNGCVTHATIKKYNHAVLKNFE